MGRAVEGSIGAMLELCLLRTALAGAAGIRISGGECRAAGKGPPAHEDEKLLFARGRPGAVMVEYATDDPCRNAVHLVEAIVAVSALGSLPSSFMSVHVQKGCSLPCRWGKPTEQERPGHSCLGQH